MRLEEIGFYTLSDERVRNTSEASRLSRCELILTSRCNFRCPYCRQVGGPDMPLDDAKAVVNLWADQGLTAIRFSGGEPTVYRGIFELVELAKRRGIGKIAISSNGSAPWSTYERLIVAGVNDFSISLDACCAEDGDKMAGGVKGAWDRVVANIRRLSERCYVTVGVVLTPDNLDSVSGIIEYAAGLGVSDIRIIPAAQEGDRLAGVQVDEALLEKYPILRYRIRNIQAGRPVRGLAPTDYHKCALVLDDMAVCQGLHYPCIIYLREGGAPIGEVGPDMRASRRWWFERHDSYSDPICRRNCLDVCVEFNNKFRELLDDDHIVEATLSLGRTLKHFVPSRW